MVLVVVVGVKFATMTWRSDVIRSNQAISQRVGRRCAVCQAGDAKAGMGWTAHGRDGLDADESLVRGEL
jgi:hypothetical protein